MEGVGDVLDGLATRYAAVVIVTGRPAADAAASVGASRIRYEGVYGLEFSGIPIDPDVRSRVEAAIAIEPAAWLEDKRVSLAVHYRQAADPLTAREALLGSLEAIVEAAGLQAMEGKAAIELAPAGGIRKSTAVRRVVSELDLTAALFAGDDHADLDAFASLDDLATQGLVTLKVAVRGAETPAELVEAADVVADDPDALVEILRSL